MFQSNTPQEIDLAIIGTQIEKNVDPTEQMAVPVKTKMCETCGSVFLIPSGTCYVCQNCGTSGGCS